MHIEFSPPDIGNEEMLAIQEVLKSGWLTTGPKTKLFEKRLASYCGTKTLVALNSATSALEICLRLLGIGPGDEVITTAYTYTASASIIYHVGATPVLVDVLGENYHIDPQAIAKAISKRTKAVIAVDYAGVMCDYGGIRDALNDQKQLFNPTTETLQEDFDTPILIADGAHSFGATFHGQMSGQVADFTVFSFHAVKNLVTGEGGALTWRSRPQIDDDALYRRLMLLSLHGQTKDALSKNRAGSWEYDIVEPYYKCNMTDISAAIGLVQLERYPTLLKRRHEIIERYTQGLHGLFSGAISYAYPFSLDQEKKRPSAQIQVLCHTSEQYRSSGHLFPLRVLDFSETQRDCLIRQMASYGISCNVHYKPLPLLSAYRHRGFDIESYPHAFSQYANVVSLPLHTLLKNSDLQYILESFEKSYTSQL